MISSINIDNYKCLIKERLTIKPLTIITGINSSGKSSLIQSILVPAKFCSTNGLKLLDNIDTSFYSIRNIYKNAKEIKIELTHDDAVSQCVINQEQIIEDVKYTLVLEENLYYLSANRTGVDFHSKISIDFKVGTAGEYILGTYEKEKSTTLREELIKDESSYTLSHQVNYWISYILGISLELQTEKRTEQMVEVKYKSDGIPNLSPFQLGSGVGYLTKILIMCLRAKVNDIIIIENPEIHLHPSAQAKLGDFFVFIANAGIQLILETHCEHLIYKIQYNVYKKRLENNKVVFLYKKNIITNFEVIDLKGDGKFLIEFPDGFFDATIKELIEME